MTSADQTLFRSRPTPPLWRAVLAILPVVAAAALGSIATTPNIPVWYEGLQKPVFTPPNWLFAPVWTVLYLMMAAAIWRVMSVPADFPGRSAAIGAFFVQLALNAGWSWAFFGFHDPAAGLAVIVVLLVMILATIRLFWHLDRVAAWLLVPYAAWVTYALALNFEIWRLNG